VRCEYTIHALSQFSNHVFVQLCICLLFILGNFNVKLHSSHVLGHKGPCICMPARVRVRVTRGRHYIMYLYTGKRVFQLRIVTSSC